MKQSVARLNALDGFRPGHSNTDSVRLQEERRRIYRSAQVTGELAFYEQPQPDDGPDCLLVAMIAVKDGFLVRVPISRRCGASLAGEIIKSLT